MRILKHHVSVSMLLLGILDILILVTSVYIGTNIRFLGHTHEIQFSVGALFPRSLLISSALLLCLIGVGLFQTSYREGLIGILVRAVLAFFLGVAALSVMFYIFPSLFLGRGAFALSLAIAFPSVTLSHMAALVWFQLQICTPSARVGLIRAFA